MDYAEAACGKKYAYMTGWFMTVIYYPCITSVLAWLSARYTLEVFGMMEPTSGTCLALAGLYLCAVYAMNALSPVIAGKFQISATVIKLIPLSLMAVAGTIYGLIVKPDGASQALLIQNFATAKGGNTDILFGSVVATAFAYEGWIVATAINAELKDAKKNLPRALTLGTAIVMCVYIAYYIGVAGGATVETLRNDGATTAFTNIFGSVLGTVLKVFVAISCLGTLNGLMLGCTRGIYSLAARNEGPNPKVFSVVDPTNSAIVGLLLCAAWLFYFFAANLASLFVANYDASTANGLVKLIGTLNTETNTISVNWFGFDSSEIPIVTLYAMYIPIFFKMMKFKEFSPFKRIVMPIFAIIGSVFMVFAAFYAHRWGVAFYLIVFAVIMLLGRALMTPKEK